MADSPPSYNRIRAIFGVLLAAIGVITRGAQFLGVSPFWALVIIVVGLAYILFEANFNPWSTKNLPGPMRLLASVIVICVVAGIYLRPIVNYFKPIPPQKATAVPNQPLEQHESKNAEPPNPAPTAKPTSPAAKAAPTPAPIIRAGTNCPEKYKSVPTLQIAQWTIEEADRIKDLSADYYTRVLKAGQFGEKEVKAQLFFFKAGYTNCCLKEVADLRAEVICRLPPSSKVADEQFAFESTLYHGPNDFVPPAELASYAPYLRKMGMQLLALAQPRHPPIDMVFFEKIQPQFKGYVDKVTVTPKAGTITGGYIVVDLDTNASPDMEGIHWEYGEEVREDDKTVANDELLQYLKLHHNFAVAMKIDKQHPVSQQSPFHLSIMTSNERHVVRARLFAE
jgi:hypothetical protein